MERMLNWMTSRDIQIFSFVNKQLQCRLLDAVMPRITHLGGATFTIAITLLLIAFFSGVIRSWAIQALISLASSHLIVRIVKSGYPRQRPYLTLPDTRTFPHPLKDYSFPSGHTTASFSIVVVFALYSSLLTILLMPLALIVGISRMYLGLHYPTDCIIGALLGSFTSLLVVYAFSFF
jgi:undecaprenyl-diphosphatase